jgi:hypothetical protein
MAGGPIISSIDIYHPVRGWTLMPNLRHVQLRDGTVVSSRKIRSISLQKYFYEKAKRGVAPKTFNHWSPEEHLTAAEGIREYVVENDLMPLFQSRPDSPAAPFSTDPSRRLEEELEDSYEGPEEQRSD